MKILGRKIRITIRGPWNKGRKSFSFLRDEIDEGGKRTQIEIIDERIKALTRDFKDGKLKVQDGSARTAADQLKAELEKEIIRLRRDKPLSAFNQEVLARYIRDKIEVKKACQRSTLNTDIARATKAIQLLENRSIRNVDFAVIQNILDSQPTANANRHMLMTYRRLLKFVGRKEDLDKLRPKKFDYKKPPYLTEEQVEQLVKNVPEEMNKRFPLMGDLIWIIFSLGLRLSEALGIAREDVGKSKKGNVIVRIQRQWVRKIDARTESDRLRPTKNRKVREVLPLEKKRTLAALARWIKMYPIPSQREDYRNAAQRYIKEYCRRNFALNAESGENDEFFLDEASLPQLDEERVYKAVHMLRAGHAVEMLRRTNGNYNFVANQIGDNPEVLRRHYSGEVNVQSSMDDFAKAVTK